MQPAGLSDLLAKGLSKQLSEWASQPGCDSVKVSISSADFGNDGVALKDSLKNFWNILKAKCTLAPGTFPQFLQVMPHGVIVRDSDNGHAWLIDSNGFYDPIPTGGDYLCFTGQGHPVYELAGFSEIIENFGYQLAKCTPGAPHVTVQAPPAPVSTVQVINTPAPVTVTRTAEPPPTHTQAPRPPATSKAAPPPPTHKQTTPPPPAPPATMGFHIEDDYYGGTWARTDPNDGTWHTHGNPPANGAYWYPNGLGVAVDCARSAAGYVVRYSDGHTQTWTWWLHVTDGKWYPAAATQEIFNDGNPGLATC
jgi:hypothetical protein